ncbi:MAG: hypothetical protein LBK29_04435, partial [Oscillospiraceae bacterium]|nr:hypothetical protein [Oscillospiraceae bacterium]
DILPIFAENDINWNAAPSNYLSDDFIKTRKKITKLLAKNFTVYDFDEDSAEIRSFIKNNFIPGIASTKSPITKNNFPHIYNRWVTEVKPTINISAEEWLEFKNSGVLDCDFFRADMMSKDGTTITERLKIVLGNDRYKLQEQIKGRLFSSEIDFTDGGAAYRRFWNKYERPPTEEYQQYIIDRRDLLVPQNIREVKGSFFTPQIWVEKSQEYIEKALGVNWQDEYIIWDCAAGTGNLLTGLVNKYNIWASTIDQPDVDTMHAMIDEGLNLLHGHIFKFDFLNDKFDKLPEELKEIVNDPEKRKKLIIYINPPYAEAADARVVTGSREENKTGVAKNKTHERFDFLLGKANRELFIQFLARIYKDIDGCIVAEFSKLKSLQSPNYKNFRLLFKAKLLKIFVVPAYTFDNVSGKFPIGFKVWSTSKKEIFKKTLSDIFNENGIKIGTKNYYSYDNDKVINDWLKSFIDEADELAAMCCIGNDFQHTNYVNINFRERLKGVGNAKGIATFGITKNNLVEACVYYAVRHTISSAWFNDRDQFLFPNDHYKKDIAFKNNCLMYTLFNNNIQSKYGTNHWIPYSEQEVDAKGKFKSNFMHDFIKGTKFSREAKKVLNSGLELWKYYHAKTQNNRTVSVNASFYDIRDFFQGRNANGKMNNKSTDETYNKIIKTLRDNVKLLAQEIEPKIYKYGFLK